MKRNEEQKSKDQPAATLRTGNPIVKKKKTLEEEWATCERAYVSGHDSSSSSEDDGYQRKDQEVAKSATKIGGNFVTDKGVIFYACNAVCLFDFFIIVIILF